MKLTPFLITELKFKNGGKFSTNLILVWSPVYLYILLKYIHFLCLFFV